MTRRLMFSCFAMLAFAAAVIAHPPGRAYACSCVPAQPPAAAAAQAQAVFSGSVANVANQANGVLVTFEVENVWKGPSAPQLTLGTSGSSASCGYDFVAGEKYIVYAFAQDGQLATGLCTRTAPLAGAAEDLAALGPGAVPEPGDEPAAAPPAAPAESPSGLPLLPIGLGVVVLGAVAAGVAWSRSRRG